MASAQQFRLLLVCTANECRSVFAASALTSQAVGFAWAVASAGTEVVAGTAACGLTGLADSEHRSRPVSAELVSAADLVLSMERQHRTRIAEVLPAARRRSFTLVEAVRFAEIVAASLVGERPSGDFQALLPADWSRAAEADRLRWLVSEMHEARSYFDPVQGDIADAHGDNAPPHEHVFNEITAGVEQLTRAISRVMAHGAGS